MSTQLLIYETAVPVNNGRHGKCSVEVGKQFGFAKNINSVPLMAVEFPQAAAEYAIVFAKAGEEVIPVVVLGARQNENLYLSSDDDSWQAAYIPAFIRRYPFVFTAGNDGKTFTLCVDEAFPGLNYLGRGQALFDEEGKPTAYVQDVLKFQQEYGVQFMRTKAFCAKINELELLEPMHAKFSINGEETSLVGFYAVSRAKLKEIPAEKFVELVKTDELELLYLHLYSMRNFNTIKDKLMQKKIAKDGQPQAQATETAAANR